MIKPGLPYSARYVEGNGILLFGKGADFQAVIGNAPAVVMVGASERRVFSFWRAGLDALDTIVLLRLYRGRGGYA